MWSPFNSPGKKKELLKGLDKVFEYLSIEFRIPLTDFPDVNETRRKLAKYTNMTKKNMTISKISQQSTILVSAMTSQSSTSWTRR